MEKLEIEDFDIEESSFGSGYVIQINRIFDNENQAHNAVEELVRLQQEKTKEEKLWQINVLLVAMLGYQSLYRAELKEKEHSWTDDLYDEVFISIGNAPESDYQRELVEENKFMTYDDCIEALDTRIRNMLESIDKLPV